MPFLVNNHVLAYNLVTSEIGDRMSAQCEADIPNSKVLGYSTIGIRQMTNKDKPFYSPADLKGVKIRTMNDRVQVATFQAMGASVTSVSYSELFTALQQGVVDAQENPMRNIYNAKFAEVQNYMTLTNHSYTASAILMNKQVWDSISPEDQAIIQQLIDECTARAYARMIINEEVLVDLIKNQGMEIIELTPEQQQAFIDLCEEKVYSMCEEIMGSERYNAMLKKVDELNADPNLTIPKELLPEELYVD